MKGESFTKLVVWYEMLLVNNDQIVNLLENECQDPKSVSNSLGVLKCGLFSLDHEVAKLACQLLTAISKEITRRAQLGRGIDGLLAMVWEWYTTKSQLAEVDPTGETFDKTGGKSPRLKSPKKPVSKKQK